MRFASFPPWVDDVLSRAAEHIGFGRDVFFKWTCAGCGIRQSFPERNKFYTSGTCVHCGHVTDLLTFEAHLDYVLVTLMPRRIQ